MVREPICVRLIAVFDPFGRRPLNKCTVTSSVLFSHDRVIMSSILDNPLGMMIPAWAYSAEMVLNVVWLELNDDA